MNDSMRDAHLKIGFAIITFLGILNLTRSFRNMTKNIIEVTSIGPDRDGMKKDTVAITIESTAIG